MQISNLLFLTFLISTLNALNLVNQNSLKTILTDPCPGENPQSGCVFLWKNYTSRIEVCSNVTDLRTYEFDDAIVALKFGNWTQVTLWDDYNYQGNLKTYTSSGFYRLSDDFTCKTSSFNVIYQKPHTIRGYIRNFETNAILTSTELAQTTLVFNQLEVSYTAKINTQNSTYVIIVPEESYIRVPTLQNYISFVKKVDIYSDSEEIDENNTVYLIPSGGSSSPVEGCIWLYKDDFTIMEICKNVADLRAFDFDQSTVSIRLGAYTKVQLWSSYQYTGETKNLTGAGYYALTDFRAATSSLMIGSTRIQLVTVRGYIKNGAKNELISSNDLQDYNALIVFIGSDKNYTANIIFSNSTYSVELLPGSYIRNASLNSYVSSAEHLNISVGSNEDFAENLILLVPQFLGWRAVLTWNGNVDKDLDSFLKLPNGELVFYRKKKSNDSSIILDFDSRNSGPETTQFTFNNQSSGTYRFYVKSYTESANLTASQGKVLVYHGNSQVSEITVPVQTNESRPTFWNPFNLVVDGLIQSYDEVNVIKPKMD